MSHRAQALNLEGAEGGSHPRGSTVEMPTNWGYQCLRAEGSGWQESPTQQCPRKAGLLLGLAQVQILDLKMNPDPGNSLQPHSLTKLLASLPHTSPSKGPRHQPLGCGHLRTVLPAGWAQPGSLGPAALLGHCCQTLRRGLCGCEELMPLSEGLPKGTPPGLCSSVRNWGEGGVTRCYNGHFCFILSPPGSR